MAFNHRDHVPSRLKEALRTFMERRTSRRPVSITMMLKRTRYAMPELAVSDEELAEIIAEQIIINGGDVDFDGKESENTARSA